MIKFLVLFVSGSSSTTSVDTTDSSSSAISTPPPEPDWAVKTISEEIAQVSSTFSLTEEEDSLFHTAAHLDAVRDNLCHMGYFHHTLWNELDVGRDIVLRSISWKARLDME
jgi:protein-tyrosine phosphatase